MTQDAKPFLDKLDLPSDFLVNGPQLNKAKGKPTVARSNENTPFAKVLPEFEKLPQHLFDKFVDRYWFDLHLLGYSYEHGSKRATCGLTMDGNTCC